jgi:dihydrofolate reductase
MGTVVYSMITSVDGYIEDSDGAFTFATPDEELHRLANEQADNAAAFLFGRRLYEVMEEPWTTAARQTDLPDVEAQFARLYARTPRVVFSDTLDTVPAGVRLIRRVDAEAEVVRLKSAADGELNLGGAGLAASLIDLIDEFRVFVVPVAVGGGKPFFPVDAELRLDLVEHRGFASGTVYLRYRRRP